MPHPWSCWRPGSSRRSGSGNPRRCCQRGPPRSAQLASPDSRGLWARGAAAVGARGRRCPHLPASSPRSARSSCFASLSSVRARERSLPKKPLDTSIARGAEGRGSARTTRQRSRQAALRSTLEPAAAFETAPTHAPLAPRALARSAASNSREERRRHLAARRGAGAGSGGGRERGVRYGGLRGLLALILVRAEARLELVGAGDPRAVVSRGSRSARRPETRVGPGSLGQLRPGAGRARGCARRVAAAVRLS